MTFILLYLGFGVIAGLLAGLLGLGGGIVIIPMLLYAFGLQGINPEHIHHLALGTSLASIVFTSISSVRTHSSLGNVLWPVVLLISPGILVGAFVGGQVIGYLPTKTLQWIFVCFLFYVGTQLLLDIKPKASRELPKTLGMSGVGLGIGMFSSFVGIGGGTLSVPFLVWCNTNVRKAIGTSAAIGFPIALAGSISAIIAGWSVAGLPQGSLGFVHLHALLGIAAASVIFAPMGARLAQKLPIPVLKRFFAVFVFIVAIKMLVSLI